MLAKLTSPSDKKKQHANVSETADMRDTLSKTEKQIRKMQRELEQRENPSNQDEASIESAF